MISISRRSSCSGFRCPRDASCPIPFWPDKTPDRISQLAKDASGLILIVDDDETSRFLEGKMLEWLGFRTGFASNGEEALEAFETERYSAILMDIVMPVMDGLQATARIREIESVTKTHVPIIAVTADLMLGNREKCFAAGVDHFLSKPFKKEELVATLTCVFCGA